MECLSPFKNLWLSDADFLRFLEDPQGYMAEEPVPDHMQAAVTVYDNGVYPVLRLGDIYLNCNHSSSMEQAVKDWKRRREKINWDFTVAVMPTAKRTFVDKLKRLDTVDRILCIVPYKSGDPFSISLPFSNAEQDVYGWINAVNATAYSYRNPFDMYSLFFGELKDNEYYDPALKS